MTVISYFLFGQKFGVTWPSPWDEIENTGFVTPWRVSQGLIILKRPFASVDPVRAYRSCVSHIWQFSDPRELDPNLQSGENVTIVHHSSTSNNIPNFNKIRRKKCGRTSGHCPVSIRLSSSGDGTGRYKLWGLSTIIRSKSSFDSITDEGGYTIQKSPSEHWHWQYDLRLELDWYFGTVLHINLGCYQPNKFQFYPTKKM